MTTFPMGTYGDMAAEFIRRNFALGDSNFRALELGTGVGNTSLQVDWGLSKFVASDINTNLIPKQFDGRVIDFNYPFDGFPPQDLVFATNAIHCAKSPADVIGNVARVLRTNGVFLLAEGAPEPFGEPWPLHYFYGLWDGWWDRGGFIQPSKWLALLSEKFRYVGRSKFRAGLYDLGGLYWGKCPL